MTDADEPVWNRMDLILIHVLLLLIHLFQYHVSHKLLWGKLYTVRRERFHVPKATAYILQLLLYRLADLFAVRFLHFARFR